MSVYTVREGQPLSAREVAIVELVADGMTNKDIGSRLYLSPATVKKHLDRIGAKTGKRNRAGLVAWALRTGVIS